MGLWRLNHGYLPTKLFFRRLEIKVDVFFEAILSKFEFNTFEAQEVKVVTNITFKMMKLFTLVRLKQIDLSLFFVDGKNRKRIIPTFKMYDIDCCTVPGVQVFFCVCSYTRKWNNFAIALVVFVLVLNKRIENLLPVFNYQRGTSGWFHT